MKKLIVSMILLLVISLLGCSLKDEKANSIIHKEDGLKESQITVENNIMSIGSENNVEKIPKKINVNWEFCKEWIDDMPYTSIYLNIGGYKYDIGRCIGTPAFIEKESGWKLVEDAFEIYLLWYGGGGEIIGLVEEDNHTLKVIRRMVEEHTLDEATNKLIDTMQPEEILKVEIEENQVFEWAKPLYITEQYIELGAYHPIRIDESIIGGYKDARWFNQEEMKTRISGKEKYQAYKLWNEQKLYVGTDWDAQPRQSQNQNLESETYKKLYPNLKFIQNILVDLEGDGEDEVLIVAQNEENEYVAFGRKLIEGTVQEIPLVWDIQELITIIGLFDLTGDGQLEIIMKDERYGYRVIEWNTGFNGFLWSI